VEVLAPLVVEVDQVGGVVVAEIVEDRGVVLSVAREVEFREPLHQLCRVPAAPSLPSYQNKQGVVTKLY
jgi:hypothetical protein